MQVLAGFANAVVLVFVALNICLEASVHLMEGGHDVMTHRLLPVSVAGFAVNVLGLAFAHEAHQHAPGECHLPRPLVEPSLSGPRSEDELTCRVWPLPLSSIDLARSERFMCSMRLLWRHNTA